MGNFECPIHFNRSLNPVFGRCTLKQLLGLVKGLSHPDKVALISYLKKDVGQEEPFRTDEFGRIILTKKMRDAVHLAERDLEEGKCYTESEFKAIFSKWLSGR